MVTNNQSGGKDSNKMGRPKLKVNQKLGERLAFRPKKSVRRYIDQQVKSGTSTSVSNAINEAIDRLKILEAKNQNTIFREFGGERNCALALIVSRIAVGVEHKRQRQWLDIVDDGEVQAIKLDPEGLFQILLVTSIILRDMLGDWTRPGNQPENEDPKERAENDQKRWAWANVVDDVRASLNDPEKSWWPMTDAEHDESIVPVNKLTKLLSHVSKGRTQNPSSRLTPYFRNMAKRADATNLEKWFDQVPARWLKSCQKDIERKGHNLEELSEPEIKKALEDLSESEMSQSIKKKSKQKEYIFSREFLSPEWSKHLVQYFSIAKKEIETVLLSKPQTDTIEVPIKDRFKLNVLVEKQQRQNNKLLPRN